MISKLRAGKLSAIGLIGINISSGIVLMPNIYVSNIQLVTLILQIGALWFGISLWIVLKYTLVELFGKIEFSKVLNRIVFLIALIGITAIMTNIFPLKELYVGNILLKLILFVDYLIVLRKIYNLDSSDLKNVSDLHNWALSIIILAISIVVLSFLKEFVWHIGTSWILYFLNAVPILFLIQFFRHIILRLKKENKASA